MTTAIYPWVEKRRASQEKHQKDPLEKEENFLIISTFESVLNNQVSASSAVNRINEIVSPRLISGLRSGVGFVWGSYADATKHFGATHTRQLVDLIIAIRELPDVVNGYGHVITFGGKVIWKEMPEFGWIFREHGVEINGSDGFSYDEWHAQEEEFLNSTVLIATLMKENENFSIGMAYHAHNAFKEIEWPFDDTREMADEWKMYIPPTEAWISIAGANLYELCFDGSIIPSSKPYGWLKKCFDAERWALWKRRFAELAEQKDIDERCQKLARSAADQMEGIEHKAQN